MGRTLTAITVGAALAAFIVFLAAVFVGSGGTPHAGPADPAHTPPPATRALLVSATSAPVSRPGGVLHGRLVEGPMPHAAMMGEVLSDEDCGPDMHGIS